MTEQNLPELPEPQKVCWIGHELFTADQMHAYARAAIEQSRAGVPSEEMIERGRSAVMALDCSGPKWTVRQHYEAAGWDVSGIPGYLLDMRPPLPKANRAELVWYAMTAAPAPDPSRHPEPQGDSRED